VRLARADTAVLLDFSLARCVWRALRRGRERWDFWWWVLTWRRVWRPRIRAVIVGADVDLVVLRSPREVEAWLTPGPL
jgi:hypothetical protein